MMSSTTCYALERGGDRFAHTVRAMLTAIALAMLPAGAVSGDGGVADILAETGALGTPENRRESVAAIRAWQAEQRRVGEVRAHELNLPLRRERLDGTVKEIAGVDAIGNPVYYVTHNDRAAISTGADRLHAATYGLSGSPIVIGMWDGGAGRSTHREFEGGRMVIMDGAAPIAHATHVGGTLAAAGVTAQAKGMAYAARVDSYDWNQDKAEMTARAATGPDDPDALFLSNHSYGYITGWFRTGGSNPAYIWYGSGSTANDSDPRFGQYNTVARDSDAIAYNAPYYLMFRSAGNDRTDNPTAGQTVQLSPSSTATVTYDPTQHPAGDGVYRGGYDTISFDAVAKNVITIGSVSDAVTAGLRDPTVATVSSFSSWGPTDDGRIKPDLVANGESLYSTLNGGDASYGTFSGTSMSAPNATGTAALLVALYRQYFPGGAMRASTLKGLLIHTADDLGTRGPNYAYGWGLLNGTAAANLVIDHAGHPEKLRMQEDLITSADNARQYAFVWDGITPIRATLSWTDPPGTATTSTDLRSPRLRNNLDLHVTGPDGTLFRPYVMPFIGSWTQASMAKAATNGVNNTDTVEQVYIASPAAPGVYYAVVSYQGTLTDGQQAFALLLDGASGEEPPPPALAILSVSPTSAFATGITTLTLTGMALDRATALRLTRDGLPDIPAVNLRMTGDQLVGEVDLQGASPGVWNVVARNDEDVAQLDDALTIRGALWAENFDGTVTGWSSVVLDNRGANAWQLVDDDAHTEPYAYFAAAPSIISDTALVSPTIPIPEDAANLQMHFHHQFDLEYRRDGGRLELQVDNGAWIGVGDEGSGTVFASRGYSVSILPGGRPADRSSFAGEYAWTGNSGGFIETIVSLVETERFAGNHIRFRWILATDNSNASPGWYVDSIVLLGDGNLRNQPPTIVEPIAVAGAERIEENDQAIQLVAANMADMTIGAVDDGGPENLTYSWSATGPAPVFFMPATGADADATTANFEALGDYNITATVTDSEGLSSGDMAIVRILAAPTAVRIDPGAVTLRVGEYVQFAATLLDQFNDPMEEQPDAFAWSTTGGGSVDTNGLYRAETVGENFSVSATAGTVSGSLDLASALSRTETSDLTDFAQITVLQGLATATLVTLRATHDGMPQAVDVETEPEGLSVAISYNGSETAPARPGQYEVLAWITDPNYEGGTNGIFTIAYDREAFDVWIATYGLSGEDAAPDADPDGNGMSNLYKWRLTLDPTNPTAGLQVGIIKADGNYQLTINRVIPEGAFTVQHRESLRDAWLHAITIIPETAADNFSTAIGLKAETTFWRVIFTLDYTGF